MARVDTGNPLTTALLQPGGKFQTDGYGLVTGVLVFKEDKTGSSSFLARGQPCPVASYSFCNVHKASSSLDALGISTYTVEYVGISAADAGSSTITKPQITGSQGLTSENITTHPNFFVLATGFTGSPIAGVGPSPGSKATPNYQPVTNGDGRTEYVGNNGATFEKKTGGKFLGFKVPDYDGFYGKTNYLAPQSSFTGHFYTSVDANVTNMRDRVGKTSASNSFGGIKLVPDYVGTTFLNGTKHQLLLAQVSFEDFALLRKVTYEVRYNREGYEPSVYAPA